MEKPKLVVLDCDGVMFDSKDADRRYYDDILAAFGHPPMTREETDYAFMHDVATGLKHIFRHYPQTDWAAVERLARETAFTPYLRRMRMMPGLVEFLEAIRDEGIRTAVATNRGDTMEGVLETFHLEHLFDFVMTAALAPPKPSPEGMTRILAHFGLPPAAAVHIGDTPVDEQYAKAAGVGFIAFGNPALAADFHAASFAELRVLPPFAALAAKG